MATSLRLVPARRGCGRPDLDEVQRGVVEHGTQDGNLVVLGAPGSGKTTTATALLERRLASAGPDHGVLMLVPTRVAAARIRDEVSARIARTVGRVDVRTPASIAYSVLRTRAGLLGEPEPTLVSGPEQDAILADLLAGHAEGVGRPPSWPERVPASARRLRAFRDELRDVLMRAAEAGLGPTGLAALGRRRRRPEWVAAAAVLRDYEEVLQLGRLTPGRGDRYDSAVVLDEAVAALRSWSRTVPGAPPPRFGTVIVDDHQDSTLATARLLRALADDGAQVIAFGDADTAVHAFRGAVPGLLAAAASGPSQPGGLEARTVVLPTVWRQTPALRQATAAVTACLRATGGTAHRAAPGARVAGGTPSGAPAGVEVAVLGTQALEAAAIARLLREEHLYHGTDYAAMAVVVRSGAEARALRRRLAAAGVPVAAAAGEAPLRDAPPVAGLLSVLAAAGGAPMPVESVLHLLTSPLAGADRLDSVSLRVLRRAVRAHAADRGDGRSGDALLAGLLDDAEALAALPSRVRVGPSRVAAMVHAARRAAARPGAGPEAVLWAAWDAAGVAEVWRRSALAGGAGGDRADRDLDAVLELFRLAEQHAERHPAAGAAAFVRHVRQQDVPADSLAARTAREHAVEVVTAAGAAGREWDVVAVPGVQEESWPDLRVRDTLLRAHELADIAAGRAAPDVAADLRHGRDDVLQDELRGFAVAVSRARRRLVVTAVRGGEVVPSPFVDILGPACREGAAADPAAPDDAAAAGGDVPLDLRGMVAVLRAEVLGGGDDADAAAELLATLAEAGVPGADPRDWPSLLTESTSEPLWGPDDMIELSPSSLETVNRCAVRWVLEKVGGRRAPGLEQSVGTLIHEIAAEHPHGTHAELAAALDRRWPELGLPDTWSGRRQRTAADRMIERLADYLAARPGRVEVERMVEAQVGRVLVRGRVDRLEHADDGSVRVVDLKTGASMKSAADAASDPQLGAYQAALRRGGVGDPVPPGGAALVYLSTGASATQRHQGPEDGWAEEMLATVAGTVAASSFAATVGDACRTCPVTSSCPARPEGGRVGR